MTGCSNTIKVYDFSLEGPPTNLLSYFPPTALQGDAVTLYSPLCSLHQRVPSLVKIMILAWVLVIPLNKQLPHQGSPRLVGYQHYLPALGNIKNGAIFYCKGGMHVGDGHECDVIEATLVVLTELMESI